MHRCFRKCDSSGQHNALVFRSVSTLSGQFGRQMTGSSGVRPKVAKSRLFREFRRLFPSIAVVLPYLVSRSQKGKEYENEIGFRGICRIDFYRIGYRVGGKCGNLHH